MRAERLIKVFVAGVAMLLVVAACGGGTPAAPTSAPTAPSGGGATTVPAATTTARPTSAPTPSPTAVAQPAGALTVAISAMGDSLDPNFVGQAATSNYYSTLFDSTIWYDKEGTPIPGIFARWEMATNGLAWTFNVRDSMKFHSGANVSAEDIVYSAQRLVTPGATASAATNWKLYVASITAPDSKTVQVQLKNPWMTVYASVPGGTPKASFENAPDGKAFNASPIGSGPFKFVSQAPGQRLKVEATGSAHLYRRMPDFKTIEFVLVPEESTRVAMLKTAAADFLDVTPDTAVSLEGAGTKVLDLPGIQQVQLNFWGLAYPDAIKGFPIADPRVRQALELAINRQEIVDTLLRGRGFVSARTVIFRGVEGYDPTWKATPYDPASAKKLLAEAGYASGLKIKFSNTSIPQSAWTVLAAEAIAGYWKTVGVTTEIAPIEYNTYRTMYREVPHKSLLGTVGWYYFIKGFEGLQFLGNYASDFAGHILSDPVIDAAIKKGKATIDPKERLQLIREISDRVANQHVAFPISESPLLYAVSTKISGWEPVQRAGPGYSWETVKRKA